jgi:hypothetical protein
MHRGETAFEQQSELWENYCFYSKTIRKNIFSDSLEDKEWLLKLAYLADMHLHLNTLNISVQGPTAF